MFVAKDNSPQPLTQAAMTWILLIPLFFYACRGILWFQAAGGNGLGSTGFGSMGSSKGGGEVAVFLVITSCVFLCLFTRILSIAELCWQNKVFVILTVYAVITTRWSQMPRQTLQYGIDAVLNVLFVFYLYSRFGWEKLMRLLAMLGWIVVLGSIFFAVALPSYGVDHRASTSGSWQGIFVFKNTCAIMATFLLSVGFYLPTTNLRSRILRNTYILMTIFLIIMTRARTGWIVMAGLMAYVGLMKLIQSFRSDNRIAVATMVIMVSVPIVVCGIVFFDQILLAMGKDPTLTGRTDIWKLVIVSAMKRRWTGYGYRSFWLGLKGESAYISLAEQWTVPAAHNGILEAWLDLGWIGLALFGFSFARAVRDAVTCLKQVATPRVQWYVSILVMTVIVNIAEMTIMVPNYLTWMMYVLACVGLADEAKKIRSSRRAAETQYLPVRAYA